MMFTNRWMLSGVLLVCSYGAAACSDEPASLMPSIDAGVRSPVADGDDDDMVAVPKRDAGTKKDAGVKDAGAKDAGAKDAGIARGMDAGPSGATGGPAVVQVTRDPNPAANIAGSDGAPAVRTDRCPAGTSKEFATGVTVQLDGCCLASGQCGIVPTLEEFRTTCVTRDETLKYASEHTMEREIKVPVATSCAASAGN